MESLTHFDPINLAVVIIGMIGAWFTLLRDSKWHSEWIRKHSEECDQRDKTTSGILVQLQVTTAKLTEIADSNCDRLSRLESQMDKKR